MQVSAGEIVRRTAAASIKRGAVTREVLLQFAE